MTSGIGGERPTVKSTFAWLLARGFWPVPIRARGEALPDGREAEGKEPFGAGWGLERWSLERGNGAFSAVPGRGVGVCLGPGRGPRGSWLVDLEGDGPGWEESLAILFGGEDVPTLGWDSARGGHRLYLVDAARMEALLPRLKGLEGKGKGSGTYKSPRFPGLEFRIGGSKPSGEAKQLQSVVPPTLGTDGSPRRWVTGSPIAQAPESFYATLEAIADEAGRTADKGRQAQAQALPELMPLRRDEARGGDPAQDVERYALRALEDEAGKVASAPEGARHDTLRHASMNLAGLVKAGALPSGLYRQALSLAGDRCGLPEAEVATLLDSAMETATPRDLSRATGWAQERASRRPAPPQPSRQGTDNGGQGGVVPPITPPVATAQGSPEDRPSIEITNEWHQAVRESIAALARDPEVYSRGGELVKVVRESVDIEKVTARTSFRSVAGTPKVLPLSDANVGVRLTTVAKFWKTTYDRKGEERATDCGPPPWLIKSIATHGHWPGIRPLLALAECPFPRPDGTIVESPGYDEPTGTLLLPSIEYPPLPDAPTREDAQAAWARISAYVEDFPFVSDDDRVIVLAGMLTIIGRPAVEGPVPGIAVIGNKAATGKGLLVDVMVIPGTGRVCPTSAYPEEKDEAVKVKVSIAMAGKLAVHFDNLDEGDSYGSGPLDSALTATVVDDRQLGKNDSPPLPLRNAWFLSGNNVTPAKDAYRRWLPIYLRSELEKPEERTDVHRPRLRADLIGARASVVHDCLVILKAHAMAGRPRPEWPGFGSFEDWSDVVRGAVWFATGLDCLATQRSTSASSPERMAKVALLEGLAEIPGAKFGQGGGVTAAEAIHLVESTPSGYETLRAALVARGRGGKLATSGSLGNILRGLRDNILDGYRLREVGTKHKVVLWAVETIADDAARGVWGSRGSNSSHTHAMTHSDNYVNTHSMPSNALRNGLETDPPDPQTPTDPTWKSW